jgi:hypothetical protein
MPLRRVLLPSFLACLAALAQAPAQSAPPRDRVVLVDGKELRGRVVHEDANEVLLRVGTTDKPIARKLVREVHAVANHHRELLQQWRDSSPDDPAAMLRLARRADEQGLPHEARLFRWYALLQRPDDVELHTALGNRLAGKQWLVALGDKRVPFDRADAMGVDFAAAWRLRSEHFELRCAAGLRTTLDTLLELEGQYHAFHAAYGDSVRLLELCEPIPVHVYRDRAQMPQQSGAIGAYYKPDEATLFTCCENGRAYALAHEATHALLHHTFGRALRAKGELPAWLDEAWAEHFAGRLQTRVPGKPVTCSRATSRRRPGKRASTRRPGRCSRSCSSTTTQRFARPSSTTCARPRPAKASRRRSASCSPRTSDCSAMRGSDRAAGARCQHPRGTQ